MFDVSDCGKSLMPVSTAMAAEIANNRNHHQSFHFKSSHLEPNTKSAQSSASENTHRERPIWDFAATSAMFSLPRITPEYDDKLLPAREGENGCYWATGGGSSLDLTRLWAGRRATDLDKMT